MKVKTTTPERRAELIMEPLLNQEQMKELLGCGTVKAVKIRKEIADKIKPKTLPDLMPTNLVVEHMCLDVSYILRVANLLRGS